MGCTACTEPQCLYKDALYLYLYLYHLDLRKIPDGLAHSCGYDNYYCYWHLALTSASSVLSGLTLLEVKVNWPVLIDTELVT